MGILKKPSLSADCSFATVSASLIAKPRGIRKFVPLAQLGIHCTGCLFEMSPALSESACKEQWKTPFFYFAQKPLVLSLRMKLESVNTSVSINIGDCCIRPPLKMAFLGFI